MKRLLHHIIRLTLIVLSVVLTVATAMAQIEVYQGQTTELSVEEMFGDTYKWDLYRDSTVNFANTDGDVIMPDEAYFVGGIDNAPIVNVTWMEPGIYFFRIMAWDSVACTNNLKIGRLVVLESLPTVTLEGDSVCIGDPPQLTFNLEGTAPWNVTYTDGTDSWQFSTSNSTHVIDINPGPITTTEYWVTEITDTYGTNTEPSEKVEVIVYPKPASSRIYQINK